MNAAGPGARERLSLSQRFVIALPVLHALADTTTNFFSGAVTPGSVRVALVVVFLMIFLIRHPGSLTVATSLLVLLPYLLGLTLLSSNVAYSFLDSFVKIFISLLMFPVGYYYLRSPRALRAFMLSLVAASAVIAVQFLIAQRLGLGQSVYLEDSFFTGGAGVETTYVLALTVVVAPLLMPMVQTRTGRALTAVALVVFMVIVLLVLRRASIAAIVAGLLVYLVFTPRKGRTLRWVGAAAAALIATAPMYVPILVPRLEVRSFENRPLESEGRYRETFIVLDETVNRGITRGLFGTELFNSPEYFQQRPEYRGVFGRGRQLHVDWTILLHGAGVVGVLLYLWFQWQVLMRFVRQYRRVSQVPFFREARAVYLAVLIGSLVISVSGSLTVIGYRSDLFLCLGALAGIQTAHLRTRRGVQLV